MVRVDTDLKAHSWEVCWGVWIDCITGYPRVCVVSGLDLVFGDDMYVFSDGDFDSFYLVGLVFFAACYSKWDFWNNQVERKELFRSWRVILTRFFCNPSGSLDGRALSLSLCV